MKTELDWVKSPMEVLGKRLIVFRADYPDDSVWSESGDLQIPAGRQLAEAIVDALKEMGCQCSEIVQRDYYGWEFNIATSRSRASVVLQLGEEWILDLATRPSFFERLVRNPINQETELLALAGKINTLLQDTLYAKGVRIMTEHEFGEYSRDMRK